MSEEYLFFRHLSSALMGNLDLHVVKRHNSPFQIHGIQPWLLSWRLLWLRGVHLAIYPRLLILLPGWVRNNWLSQTWKDTLWEGQLRRLLRMGKWGCKGIRKFLFSVVNTRNFAVTTWDDEVDLSGEDQPMHWEANSQEVVQTMQWDSGLEKNGSNHGSPRLWWLMVAFYVACLVMDP